jgi:hypothetical protein
MTLGGSRLDFVTGLTDLPGSSTALQNPPGQASFAFTSDLILIDQAKNYRVEFCVRQALGTDATAYLALSWYDKEERWLTTNVPAPAGAGNPVGWENGTYSYFGLVDASAPTKWTVFKKSFGFGEIAAIPRNVKFVRVGALLNYYRTPAAVIQVTNIRLWQKSKMESVGDAAFRSDQPPFLIVPSLRMLWTSFSQAGQLSHHWPAQQAALGFAGNVDLVAATYPPAAAQPANSDSAVFKPDENAERPASNR